ncbi:hypothetical protein GCM10020258_47760 [Sphingomonas yabuuchiae]
MFDELPLGAAHIELRPEHDAQGEVDQRGGKRQHARTVCGEEKAGDRGNGRDRQHDGEDREALHHAINPKWPR